MGYKDRDDSVREEASAFGERVAGKAKEVAGEVTGNRSLEREGERENLEGRWRQETNNVFDETDGVRGATVGATAGTERSRMVTGLFRDRESAEQAYQTLHSRGYGKDDINVVMADETRKRYFADDRTDADTELGSKAWEGAGVGGAIGAGVGATLAAIAAIGTSLVLPGLGLIIAGPLAAGLAGAGAGGLTGGIIGALVGAGIPEERAKLYDEGIRQGGILMGVNARSDEDAEYFENEWRRARGEHIYR